MPTKSKQFCASEPQKGSGIGVACYVRRRQKSGCGRAKNRKYGMFTKHLDFTIQAIDKPRHLPLPHTSRRRRFIFWRNYTRESPDLGTPEEKAKSVHYKRKGSGIERGGDSLKATY